MVDVWEVDATSLVIEDAPDGWLMCRAAIPAALVRLVRRDRDPTRRPLSAAGLVFVSRMLTIDEMTQLAGVAPDGAGTLGGASLGLESDEPHTWWTLEGRDRYAPLASVVAELFDRVRAHEAGLAVLGEQCDQVTFRAFTQETGAAAPLWEPDAKTRELLDRVHVRHAYSAPARCLLRHRGRGVQPPWRARRVWRRWQRVRHEVVDAPAATRQRRLTRPRNGQAVVAAPAPSIRPCTTSP